MREKAIKFIAEYFKMSEKETKALNTLTIDCLAAFAEQEVKNCSIPFVNERQPYSKEDMKLFLGFIGDYGFSRNMGVWRSPVPKYKLSLNGYNDDRLLKLWEDSKHV